MTYPKDAHQREHIPRRWMQFRLRSLLLLTLVGGLSLAWVGHRITRLHRQRVVVNKITSLGGYVYYDYQYESHIDVTHIDCENDAPGPEIIRAIAGEDVFAQVAVIVLDPLTCHDLAIVTELPHLEYVILRGKNVTDETMADVAHGSKLRALSLTDTKVTEVGLARLRPLTHLVSLSLYGADIDDDALSALRQLRQLKHLELVRTSVTSNGLAHVAELTQLHNLSIRGCREIDDSGMCQLSELVDLTGLNLEGTSVSDQGLQHLQKLGHLKFLNLSGTLVTDEGMRHLVELPGLVSLVIDSTRVGDAGLATLVPIRSLEHLSVGGGKLTDVGMVYAARMSSLRWLRIFPSDVSDEGVLELGTLKRLRVLRIGPHVTEAAALRLRQVVPECCVHLFDQTGSRDLRIGEPSSEDSEDAFEETVR